MNTLEYENYHETKRHVDLSFPYNTYICSIPLDFTNVPLHWHDEMEIIYIKKGMGIVTIEMDSYTVSADTIVLLLPGQLHSIAQLDDCCMEYENIIFDAGMLFSKQEDSINRHFLSPLFQGQIHIPGIFTKVSESYDPISACIDSCDEICKTKPDGYELFLKGKLFELFFILSQCRTEEPLRPVKKLNKMKPILKYVETHYHDKITIREMAELVQCSESHFMRYFKESMGVSFIHYLRDYRLTMAARLLLASESSVLSIAEEVGFDNLSYFNRAFKAKYGMTPREYRK